MEIKPQATPPASSQGNTVSVKIAFTPPLTPQQSAPLPSPLQGTLSQPQPNGQALLTLANGQKFPVTLTPPLPVGTKLTLPTPQAPKATAQLPTPPPTAQQTQAPAQTSLPNPAAPVLARTVPTYPPLPQNTPVQTTAITPPQPQGFQQLQATNPLPNAQTAVLPRVEVQPPTPLPIGTQVTVTLPTASQAILTQILAPQGTPQTKDTITLTPPLPTPTPPSLVPTLPKADALTQLISNLKILSFSGATASKPAPPLTLPPTDYASTFTVKIGAPLPAIPNTPQTYVIFLPTGQPAKLQTPQPLPPNTLLTLTQNPNGTLTPTHLNNIPTALNPVPIMPAPSMPLSVLPLPASTAQMPPLNTPFTATVSTSIAGQTTFTLPHQQGSFSLNTPAPLPINSTATLVLNPPPTAPTTNQQAPTPTVQLLNITAPLAQTQAQATVLFSRQWPALTQALSLLAEVNPSQEIALKQSLPTVSSVSTFAPQIIAFAQAVMTQAPNKFLNDTTTNVLRALGIDLTGDINTLSALARPDSGAPQQTDTWRGFFFPYAEDEHQNPGQGGFFWRQQEDEDSPDSPQIRFMVNITLSEAGPLWIDGLLQDKVLNLRLHTSTDWPDEAKADLQSFVTQMLENIGLTGTFTFTPTVPKAHPLDSLLKQAPPAKNPVMA